MVRAVKREVGTKGAAERSGEGEVGEGSGGDSERHDVVERRVLRSRYLAVKNLICDERDDITRPDSDKFSSIFTEVESLHQHVQKPREQVADAEALLDIANTLVTSVKSHGNDGLTPADFITALLRNYGLQAGVGIADNSQNMISWADIGLTVSHVFRKSPGMQTMVGPFNTEVKQRKPMVRRKRTIPTENTRPEELDSTNPEDRTDTDKNMSTMFDVLRKKRSVRLESLVLNRLSFAQTVENIFALSFLVKDGRAEMTVNESGHHLVSPKNAPAASAVASGSVSYNHFVFRLDYKDWKLMMDTVKVGDELMPHRTSINASGSSQAETLCEDSKSGAPTTPIRKLTRNRGLVVQEESVVNDSPDNDSSGKKISPRQHRRRLHIG